MKHITYHFTKYFKLTLKFSMVQYDQNLKFSQVKVTLLINRRRIFRLHNEFIGKLI